MEREITDRHSGARQPHAGRRAFIVAVSPIRPSRPIGALISIAVLILSAAFLLTACSKTVKWKEDVQLSTGEVIVIERETRFKPGGGEIATSSGWKPEVSFIRFHYPPGSKEMVEWRTTKLSQTYRTEEHPLVLNVDGASRKPFIIALHTLTTATDRYVKFVLTDGAWTEVQLPDTFEPIPVNLLVGSRATKIERHVTLEQKRAEDLSRYHHRLRRVGPTREYTGY